MSQVSTLTLALSVFHQHDMRVIDVNKSNPNFYHLYYRVGQTNRVMLVPKDCHNYQKLQSEVEILISRTAEEQARLGHADGKSDTN